MRGHVRTVGFEAFSLPSFLSLCSLFGNVPVIILHETGNDLITAINAVFCLFSPSVYKHEALFTCCCACCFSV